MDIIVINAVRMYIGYTNLHGEENNIFNLPLPSLNDIRIKNEYEKIIRQPNMTVKFISSSQDYNTYFCILNDKVYQVITHLDDNVVNVKPL